MILNPDILSILTSKATQSRAEYCVSALGFSKKGDILGTSVNSSRFPRRGGGLHAEELLIRTYGRKLKTILICRTSKSGKRILPIHPCRKCRNLANKYGIKIISVSDVVI